MRNVVSLKIFGAAFLKAAVLSRTERQRRELTDGGPQVSRRLVREQPTEGTPPPACLNRIFAKKKSVKGGEPSAKGASSPTEARMSAAGWCGNSRRR